MHVPPGPQPERPTGPPTVVVVIPYYNGSRFIERAVASVYRQSVPPDEVVVVNDGSTAEERDFLHALALRYPFRVIDQANGGQGSARNAGVAASRSSYISFLDQDDLYLPNHIATLLAAVPPDDLLFGFVYADIYEADVDGNVVRTDVVKQHSKDHPKRSIFDLLRHDMFVLPSAALIGRNAFEAVGGFDTQFMGYEDDDLFLRIFRKSYSNYFVDRAVTVWCIHTESTSFSIRMVRSRFRYFKKLTETFPDEPKRGRYFLRDYLMPRFGRFFVDHVIEAIKLESDQLPELTAHLDEYTRIVLANPYVGRRAKWKLRATRAILAHSSPEFVRTVGAATKLPLLRSLRGLYRVGK